MTLRTLRILSNQEFTPQQVCFVHGRPQALDVHRRVIGAPVEFSQPFDGIVCRNRDLDLAVPDADPALATRRASLGARSPSGL